MKSRRLTWILASLLPASIVLGYLASFFPDLVERHYSQGIYPILAAALSALTSWIPFSLSEFLLIGVITWCGWRVFRNLQIVQRRQETLRAVSARVGQNLLVGAGVLSFLFLFLWGLNYQRQTFAKNEGLVLGETPVSELEALFGELAQRANYLRAQLSEDSRGVFTISGDLQSVFNRASRGYQIASYSHPILSGIYVAPKRVFFSVAMSYLGIGGVFLFFTSEPNINTEIPKAELPSTVCHEMAHQLGFAREDEANYVAYLACDSHPDLDFQYSGVFLALTNCFGQLMRVDPEIAKRNGNLVSEGVRRDSRAGVEFWTGHETVVMKVNQSLNNAYLKSQGQSDGVHSYGRMVDLLLAERRARMK